MFRKVVLKESQLVREDNKLVYAFMLEADYEPPPPDILETVPLFTNEQADSAAAQPGAAAPRAGAQPNRPSTAQPNKQGNAPAQLKKPAPAPTPAPSKKEPR